MLASDSARDARAYALATSYLLEFESFGVTDALLAHYLTPPPARLTPVDLPNVYRRLLESAQNRSMMATVIGRAVGGIGSLEAVLCGFDPSAVLAQFTSPENLLNTIEKELRPRGKIRRSPSSLWPLFARAVLSGARFVTQFDDVSDFTQWVAAFDSDPRKRAALPLLLSREIEGFGFALSCDFLKELGFLNFAKPDVHVTAIVRGLALCPPRADDYLVYKTVVRIATRCHVTPYNVDKLLWLVGSGNFYDHLAMGTNGRIPTDRDKFIANARAALSAGSLGDS